MNKIVDDILEILQENELIQSTRVVNYDETPSGRLEAKLRSQLPKNHILQIWIHLEPESLDYAYQLFTTVPLLRWDNSPHYGNLPNAPHHFHDENGKVSDFAADRPYQTGFENRVERNHQVDGSAR